MHTHNKKCILSNIVGAIHESPIKTNHNPSLAIHESPENILTPYGKIVKKYICQIENKYQNVKIDNYVIMPNHIHILLSINDDGQIIFEQEICEKPIQSRSLLSKIVGYIKMNSSKQIHLTYNQNVWQRNYHDHIVRNEKDYENIWNYIDGNISNWQTDCFYITQQ